MQGHAHDRLAVTAILVLSNQDRAGPTSESIGGSASFRSQDGSLYHEQTGHAYMRSQEWARMRPNRNYAPESGIGAIFLHELVRVQCFIQLYCTMTRGDPAALS
jgi:hypothetical protein